MLLTPQQEELAPLIAGHLALKDPRLLVIEGLSEVGKSTLLRDVIGRMDKRAVTIPEHSHVQADKYPDADLAIFDYFDLKNVSDIQTALRDKVSAFVALAHPRFQDQVGLRRVDHRADLEAAGFPARILTLPPMNATESRDYIASFQADPAAAELAKQYGLGIAGHIRRLLQTPELNPEKAEVLTGAKLTQILKHSCTYPIDGTKKVRELLGAPLPISPQFDLDRDSNRSLEDALAFVPTDLEPRLPRFLETLEQYRQVLARGATRVELFVPDLAPELLQELGVEDFRCFDPKGHLMRLAPWAYKAGAMTPSQLRAMEEKRIREEFSCRSSIPWLKGRPLEGLPLATERSAYFAARTHGFPGHRVEAPLFTYAVETLLQARRVSYVADYWMHNEDITRHFVGSEGVEVTRRKYTND